MVCEYAKLQYVYDYSDCGDEYICRCDKKNVHIIVDYGISLESACEKLCKGCDMNG